MKLLADFYDAAYIEKRYAHIPHELLLLAREKKLKVGVYIDDYEILRLKDGLNPAAISDNRPLANAYHGTVNINEPLILSDKDINALCKQGHIKKSAFSYNKDGYDTALLIKNACNAVKNIEPKDLLVPAEDMGIFDASLSIIKNNAKRSRTHDKHECLKDVFEYLYKASGFPPEAKVVWKHLNNMCQECPPYPIERMKDDYIYWSTGGRPMKFSTLVTVLSKFRNLLH